MAKDKIINETTIIGSQDDSKSPPDPSQESDGSHSDGEGDNVDQSASGGASSSGRVTCSVCEIDVGKLQDSGVDVKSLSRCQVSPSHHQAQS